MFRILKSFTAFAAITLVIACTPTPEDPKNIAKSFVEAFAAKDYDKAAQFATKDSKTLLDLIKSMEEMGNSMDFFFSGPNGVNPKEAVYDKAVIDGEKAIVSVSYGAEAQTIKLKKEEGGWKVALDKDMLKEKVAEEAGTSVNEINQSMDAAAKEMEKFITDSIKSALQEASKEMGSDSLRKVIDKAGEVLKKTGDALQEASKKNQ
jgi:nitrous oxide reductase accessory protein NosL